MPLHSLYDGFKPIFYTSILFGTMPLCISKKPFVHLKISKYRVSYSCILFLCTVCHGIVTPWYVVETKNTVLSPISEVTNESTYVNFIRNQTSAQIGAMKVLNPLINTLMCLGSLWVSLVSVSSKLPIFLSHLADIDRGIVPFMNFRPKYNVYISLILTSYFLLLSIPVYTFYLYTIFIQGSLGYQVWSTLLLFCIATSYSTEIQFLNWALGLQIRFKVINDFLRRHTTQNDFFNTFTHISDKGWNIKQRLTIRRIELAHQCNKKLCDLIQDLNDIYQLQLLCSVAGCFIKILFNLYFALFASFINVTKNLNNIQTSNTIMWTTFYITRFLITTIVAYNASEEAFKTRSIVSCVNRRSFDSDIKEELNIFLHHSSNRTLKFTACGLFTLSTQLITSAVAAGTTYLVILIQFRPQIN